MRNFYRWAGVVLVGALFVGCKKETQPQPPSPPEAPAAGIEQPQAPAAAPEAAVKTETPAQAAPAGQTPEAAAPAAETDQPAEPPPTIGQRAKESALDIAAKAEEAGKAVATAAVEDAKAIADAAKQLAGGAQAELDKVLEAIRNGQLQDAETRLAALEAESSSLPAPMPERIAEARQTLDAAKAAETAKPALPKNAPE